MTTIDEEDLEIMEVVPQSVLIEYFRLQNRFDFLKQSIRASLERGADVERGDITAKLTKSMRQTPAWKKIAAEVLGAEKVAAIIESTPKTEIISLKVDVKKQAMVKKDELI